MKPILAEIERIAPGYVHAQPWQFDSEPFKENEQVWLDNLAGMVLAMRQHIATALDEVGCTLEDVRPHDALTRIKFHHTPGGIARTTDENSQAKYVPPENVVMIGQRIAARDPVRVLYFYLFGREPDGPGYNFYTKLLDQGVPLSVIIDDMEINKANGAV